LCAHLRLTTHIQMMSSTCYTRTHNSLSIKSVWTNTIDHNTSLRCHLPVSLPCQLSLYQRSIFDHSQQLYSRPLYRKNPYPPVLSTVLHAVWICVFLRNVLYDLPQSSEFIFETWSKTSKTVIFVLSYTLLPKPINENFPLSAEV